MKIKLAVITFIYCIIFTNCTTLKPVSVIKNDLIENYQYVVINSTESLTASAGSLINGTFYAVEKTVNPSDIISGYLAKKGFIILTETQAELNDKTLIINYGESGRRNVFWGYTIEITLQFISAETKQLLFSSTAEGMGYTEADDIREALTRALDALFI